MPDTGAPWYIPYVAGTDLVADWPTDSQELATAIAAGLDDAGTVRQVVTAFSNSAFTTTSGSLTGITGLSLSITPTSATNKILLLLNLGIVDGSQNMLIWGDVTRDGSPIGTNTSLTNDGAWLFIPQQLNRATSQSWSYIDSPATTSATTYAARIARNAGTAYVNRNQGNDTGGSSSLTAIEYAV